MTETQNTSADDFLLAGEAAQIAGVTPATVRSWTDKGWLPALTTPGHVRLIRRADLERLLAARAAEA
jgi:excisionase family DNA binding protein